MGSSPFLSRKKIDTNEQYKWQAIQRLLDDINFIYLDTPQFSHINISALEDDIMIGNAEIFLFVGNFYEH